jgi:hypothetical protein
VFIATPHRGSRDANELLGRVVAGFVRRSGEQAERVSELLALNGDDAIAPEFRGRWLNSIGSLRVDNPILFALERLPIAPGVPYHSIIPQVGGILETDGVVPYWSSHLEGASSEAIVPGTHFAQQSPKVTAELRRILYVHLAENP